MQAWIVWRDSFKGFSGFHVYFCLKLTYEGMHFRVYHYTYCPFSPPWSQSQLSLQKKAISLTHPESTNKLTWDIRSSALSIGHLSGLHVFPCLIPISVKCELPYWKGGNLARVEHSSLGIWWNRASEQWQALLLLPSAHCCKRMCCFKDRNLWGQCPEKFKRKYESGNTLYLHSANRARLCLL